LLTFNDQKGNNLILKLNWNIQNKNVEVFKYTFKEAYLEVDYSFKSVILLWPNKTLAVYPDSAYNKKNTKKLDVKITDLK